MERPKDVFRYLKPKRPYTLAQKINLAFGVFFMISTVQSLIDFGLAHFFLSTNTDGYLFLIGVLFLVLAQFDFAAIRYIQIGVLTLLALSMAATQTGPSDLEPYLVMAIALASAYKMKLFGNIGTIRFIVLVILATVLLIIRSGQIGGWSFAQQVNLINFVFTYFLLIYFIFEEETIDLRKRNEILTSSAEDMRPFAELGENVVGLVHDFKGDIAGLYALAEIERLSGNEDTAKKLKAYGERLNKRTESVLYIATGGDHFEVEEIDINTLLESTVYYFIEVNQTLKHKIRITLDGMDDPVFHTRQSILLVILENVLKNAIEATEGRAFRSVDISARRDGDTLRLEIANTGPPLPFTTKGKPVDVTRTAYFKRGRSSKQKGTGLGMTNVIRSLDILGGTMFMENTSDGVKSTILIPEAQAKAEVG